MNKVTEADEARFAALVGRSDGCWLWQGSLDARGYGSFFLNGRSRRATHIALLLAGKARPSNKHGACHSCDNPPCVNPAHLWWGTQQQNTKDAYEKGRHPFGTRQVCSEGHPLSGENLAYDFRNKARVCVTCRRARGRERIRRFRERRTMETANV